MQCTHIAPKYSVFINTKGAHTKLGTAIHFFIPAFIHLYTDIPVGLGELLWTNQRVI